MGFALALMFIIGGTAGWFVRKMVDKSLVEMHQASADAAEDRLQAYLDGIKDESDSPQAA